MKKILSVLPLLLVAAESLSAQAPVSVDGVFRLGDATTTQPIMNFLVEFNADAAGVDATDFAPLPGAAGLTVSGFGNESLDFRFGGGRPTRAFATGLVAPISQAVTVEFWVATDDSGGTMFDYASAGDLDQIRIRHSGGNVELLVHGTVICSSSTTINDQQWHHIAATYDAATSQGQLYIDTVLVDSGVGPIAPPLNAGGVVVLGSNATTSAAPVSFSDNLYGRYDDLRIWSVVRTGVQISGAHNRLQRPTAANLVLNWQCDVAENLGLGAAGTNDLRDTTVNANHAQLGNPTTPQFLTGPTLEGIRYRVTLTHGGILTCPLTVGLGVLNDGSITRVSNGVPLAASFNTGETYAFNPPLTLPGTGDDLGLSVLTNGQPKRCATAGDFLTFHFESPMGGLNWSIPLLVVQVYAPGAHPGSSLPGVQVNFAVAPLPVFLFDGSTALGAFGPALLPPAGMNFGAVMPPGYAGLEMIVQAAVISPAALNGLYATTQALGIRFY